MEKHGYKGTSTYNTWVNMKVRCNNPRAKDYLRYGGRNITVCTKWNNSFLNFLKDMGERPKGMTLDRINVNGNYHKNNCKWSTPTEQGWNTRFNKMINYKKETKCLAEWAKIYSLRQGTLAKRLRDGWPIDKALTTPLNKMKKGVAHNQKMITYKGETKNIKEWEKLFNFKPTTLWRRISVYNMSFEEAITKPIRGALK